VAIEERVTPIYKQSLGTRYSGLERADASFYPEAIMGDV
jgi:hypothetical protein